MITTNPQYHPICQLEYAIFMPFFTFSLSPSSHISTLLPYSSHPQDAPRLSHYPSDLDSRIHLTCFHFLLSAMQYITGPFFLFAHQIFNDAHAFAFQPLLTVTCYHIHVGGCQPYQYGWFITQILLFMSM